MCNFIHHKKITLLFLALLVSWSIFSKSLAIHTIKKMSYMKKCLNLFHGQNRHLKWRITVQLAAVALLCHCAQCTHTV